LSIPKGCASLNLNVVNNSLGYKHVSVKQFCTCPRGDCYSHQAPNPITTKAVTSMRTLRPISTFCPALMITKIRINERVGEAQPSWQQLTECLEKRKECRDQRHSQQRRRMRRRNYHVYCRRRDDRHALYVLACKCLSEPQDPDAAR
jgi:hypothetical protein